MHCAICIVVVDIRHTKNESCDIHPCSRYADDEAQCAVQREWRDPCQANGTNDGQHYRNYHYQTTSESVKENMMKSSVQCKEETHVIPMVHTTATLRIRSLSNDARICKKHNTIKYTVYSTFHLEYPLVLSRFYSTRTESRSDQQDEAQCSVQGQDPCKPDDTNYCQHHIYYNYQTTPESVKNKMKCSVQYKEGMHVRPMVHKTMESIIINRRPNL